VWNCSLLCTMALNTPITPILMLGAGRMGGAIVEGWALAKAFAPNQLIIRDPYPGEVALDAAKAGARLNPPDAALGEALTVVLAVKPQLWREVAGEVAAALHPQAVIVSIAAGVRMADIGAAFGGRSVARVMPTTAAGIGKGVASIVADSPRAAARARALFEPVGVAVELPAEEMLDAATAVSGSSPAYLYAFIEALEAAGVAEGLPADAARDLVRATMIGAAALLDHTGADPAELRRQVTSPNGTTEAALKVLMGEKGLGPLLAQAAAAAARRSRELAG
jgi:pyrroline-5-carboxylate reductase